MARPAEKFAGFIHRLLTGIRDPLCGMKAYRVDLLKAEREQAGWGIGTALAISAVNKGYAWTQMEVSISPRGEGRSRFAHSYMAEFRLFFVILMAVLFVKERRT